MHPRFVLGLDFGTESARALLVDVQSGEEVASEVYSYPHGVMDRTLDATGERLDSDWALQDPADYFECVEKLIPGVLQQAGIQGCSVIGVGIDFTSCTLLATDQAGVPLCMKPEYRTRPHAWPILWKHHAAQREADRMTDVARERKESFLARYGGRISSEWFFPKVLQVLHEAPDIYDAADRFIEACDWIVWQLCGVETRNICAVGYKALWNGAFPSSGYFRAVHPRFENIVDTKMMRTIHPLGHRAGGITPEWAVRTGLEPGTPVAVGHVDGHASIPGCGVTNPGEVVLILGTSFVTMVCGTHEVLIEGINGVVRDGILPGMYGYEASQAAGGDIFAWYIDQCIPASVTEEACRSGRDMHDILAEKASLHYPGQSGLVALDWWNGNRCPYVDMNLTGIIAGLTLSTTYDEIYRALLEATAYGVRRILADFENAGLPINTICACGGLSVKNSFFMQILTDVLGKEVSIASNPQTVSLGAALWGAVAAGPERGGHTDIVTAVQHMTRKPEKTYIPNLSHHVVYDELYNAYMYLHHTFGNAPEFMHSLKDLRRCTQQKNNHVCQ